MSKCDYLKRIKYGITLQNYVIVQVWKVHI